MAIEWSGSGSWRQGSITFDADAVVKNLDVIRRVQMPFVMSYALNQMGPLLQAAHRQEMERVFENPVPFTLNSIFYTRSDKTKLYSYIGVKEFGAKGNPASKYLYPTVKEQGAGGKPVYDTRFSKALAHRGYTPRGSYMLGITDSDAARLSKGRISPGQYTQVLFSIGAYDNDTYTGRRYAQAKRKPKKEYFMAKPGNAKGLKPGIYRRSGRDINMLFKYLPSPPTVSTRYDFYGLTDRIAQEQFPKLVFGKLKDVMGGR
jgi:hypothetical protein